MSKPLKYLNIDLSAANTAINLLVTAQRGSGFHGIRSFRRGKIGGSAQKPST